MALRLRVVMPAMGDANNTTTGVPGKSVAYRAEKHGVGVGARRRDDRSRALRPVEGQESKWESQFSPNTVHLTIGASESLGHVSWLALEICESDIPTFFALRPWGRSGLFAAGLVFGGFPCADWLSAAADPQGESGGVAASLRRMILREWVKDNRSGSMFWCSAASFIRVRTARWASIKP